jgi:anti-anti-sigma factor
MLLTLLSDDGTVVGLQAEGEISQSAFVDDQDPLAAVLAPVGGFGRKVIINLERTQFIDSSGIGWLLASNKRFVEAGGRLAFYLVPPLINQVLQMVKLPLIMPFVADEAAARMVAIEGRKP